MLSRLHIGFYLVWVFFLGIPLDLTAQSLEDPDTTAFASAFEARILEERWQDVATQAWFEVPFTREAQEQPWSLRLDFQLPENLPDTLHLIFSGVAWQASLEFNQYFMGTHEDPFEPWDITLAKDWFRQGENTLILTLRTGTILMAHGLPFQGIHRPIYVQEQAWANLDSSYDSLAADHLAMVAPYYGLEHGYRFDSLSALRFLLPMIDLGIKQVGFWFSPGKQLLELCQVLNLEVVSEWEEQTALGAVNAFPLAAASLPHRPYFWLDEQGNRTSYYGGFYERRHGPTSPRPPQELWLMVLLLMIPVLGLLLTKLVNPGFFSNQLNLLLSPQLFMDNS
ncbi:MAG: hypothetical protein AAF804_13945, partial [Bacteroidota bacterium]